MPQRFRPQDLDPLWCMRRRRLKLDYNAKWQTQNRPYPVGWTVNQQWICRQFYQLHYLALHAPAPVRRRWLPAYRRFYQTHFGTAKASAQYLNTWSCHSWL